MIVRTWQGKFVVDIREYYNKDGKQLPGKKGPFFIIILGLIFQNLVFFLTRFVLDSGFFFFFI